MKRFLKKPMHVAKLTSKNGHILYEYLYFSTHYLLISFSPRKKNNMMLLIFNNFFVRIVVDVVVFKVVVAVFVMLVVIYHYTALHFL